MIPYAPLTPGTYGDRLERLIMTAKARKFCGPGCALETVDDRYVGGARTIRVFCAEHGAKTVRVGEMGEMGKVGR